MENINKDTVEKQENERSDTLEQQKKSGRKGKGKDTQDVAVTIRMSSECKELADELCSGIEGTKGDQYLAIFKAARIGLKKDSIRSAGEISAEFISAIDHIMNLYNTILSGKKEAIDSKELEMAMIRKDYEKELENYKLRLKEAEDAAAKANEKAAEAIKKAEKWEAEATRLTAENERLNNSTSICAEDISTLIAFAREMHMRSGQMNKL